MAGLGIELVELHVPLTGAGGRWERSPRWIDRVERFIESHGDVEVYDDGEEYEGHYVFFLCGAAPQRMVEVAAEAAALPGVPAGSFAMVTNDDAEEFGLGRRTDLRG